MSVKNFQRSVLKGTSITPFTLVGVAGLMEGLVVKSSGRTMKKHPVGNIFKYFLSAGFHGSVLPGLQSKGPAAS